MIATIEVFCPRSAVIEWANRYFYERRGIVPLGLPLRAFGLPTFVHVYRNVAVDCTLVPDDSDPSPRQTYALRLAWKPTHGGPFPVLEGTLTVRAHFTHSWLRFTGTYRPPFGLLGRAADFIAGRHIARVSVGTLLKDIKRYIERQNLEERASLAFAAYDANVRVQRTPGGLPIPLHGSVAIRRDGDYLACAITVDGNAPELANLASGGFALESEAARRVLRELLTPALR